MVLVDNLPVKRDTFVLRQSPWNGIHIEQDLNGVARAGFASLDVDYRSSQQPAVQSDRVYLRGLLPVPATEKHSWFSVKTVYCWASKLPLYSLSAAV